MWVGVEGDEARPPPSPSGDELHSPGEERGDTRPGRKLAADRGLSSRDDGMTIGGGIAALAFSAAALASAAA